MGRAGIVVLLADRDVQQAETVANDIVRAGGNAAAQRCDVGSDGDVRALRTGALERFGRVDIVMSDVGVMAVGPPEHIPISAWAHVINVNLLSVVRSVEVFLPHFLEQGSGHFVNTASMSGLYGVSYERLPYSATKGAIVLLSESLALYTNPRGIGVTLLCPGPVATHMEESIQTYGELQGPMRGPGFPIMEAEPVGDMVVEAIRRNTFFVPTHQEIYEILSERASDMNGFVERQTQILATDDAERAEAAGTP
jgi:NAD(P)-dependent dehydrogenase (short-subunit alcohol dehydrogenase family)